MFDSGLKKRLYKENGQRTMNKNGMSVWNSDVKNTKEKIISGNDRLRNECSDFAAPCPERISG